MGGVELLCCCGGDAMTKRVGAAQTVFISPAMLAQIEADLTRLSQVEPGAKPVRDAVEALMPVIRGCRARGHSWDRIAQSFQRQVEGVSSTLLRKYAYEFDPSLKGNVKGLVPQMPEDQPKGPGKTKAKTAKSEEKANAQTAVNF